MQDPVRTKLARAHIKLDAAERRGDASAGSTSCGTKARNLVRSWRLVVEARQRAADLEECERHKLLKGDPSSRCMFLARSAS